jgi:hypothetical protein
MAKFSPYQEMAVATLCQSLLTDAEINVRCRVAQALGEIGNEVAIPTLLQALNADSSPEVRQHVVQAISRLFSPNLSDRLIDLVETHGDTIEIIVKNLAERANNESLPDILNNLQQILKNMSEQPKVQMNFNAPVSGVAGNVEGDLIVNPTPKTLAEAAQEIQQLLAQLSQAYPTNTEAEKQIFIDQVDTEIQTNSRLRSILIAGGIELIKILCPPLGIPIEMGQKWLETAQKHRT